MLLYEISDVFETPSPWESRHDSVQILARHEPLSQRDEFTKLPFENSNTGNVHAQLTLSLAIMLLMIANQYGCFDARNIIDSSCTDTLKSHLSFDTAILDA